MKNSSLPLPPESILNNQNCMQYNFQQYLCAMKSFLLKECTINPALKMDQLVDKWCRLTVFEASDFMFQGLQLRLDLEYTYKSNYVQY